MWWRWHDGQTSLEMKLIDGEKTGCDVADEMMVFEASTAELSV